MHLFLFLLGIGILNPHAYEVFFAPLVTSIWSATDTVFALFVAIASVPQVQVAAFVELLRIPPPTRVPKLPPTPTVPSPAHHLSSPLAYLVSASIMVVLLTIVFLVRRGLRQRYIPLLPLSRRFPTKPQYVKRTTTLEAFKDFVISTWSALPPSSAVFCASHGHLVVPRHTIPKAVQVAQPAEREIAVPEQQPLVQPENVPAPAPVDDINEPAEQVDIVEPEPALLPAPVEPASPVASSSNSDDDNALAPASPTFTEATLVEGDEDDRMVEEFRQALAGYRGRRQRRARPAMENPFDVHSMDNIHIQYANTRAFLLLQQMEDDLAGMGMALDAILGPIQSDGTRQWQ
ncbi:hypothetical protein EIP91_006314 [Steccherinum ochraceum]|uniref:Uncharacterized protein n=1 Tax=Steccherinum ochraceum TaxID=92696 RepID=A0A4R0RZ81_9APHY|nr:hypothetical protein EIP91_006314 [Steccherinum ochraceum]